MRIKRIIAAIMCLILCAGTFCGCDRKVYITTGLKDDEIFKLSGNPCRLSEMLLVLMTEKNRYEADLGSEIWSYEGMEAGSNLEDEIKAKVKKQLATLKTIELLAEEKKVVLSDNEKESLKAAASEYFNSLSKENAELLGVTEEDVLSLYTSFFVADKLYEKLTYDVNVEVSDEEARVIQFNYIMFSTSTLNEAGEKLSMTAQEKQVVYAKANEVMELLNGGSDFSTIAAQYSDSQSSGGYLSRGEIHKNLEDAVFELKSGEISSIIETEGGYYIMQCVSDYIETRTAENKLDMMEEYKRQVYAGVYEPFEAEQTFEFNDDVWDAIHLQEYSQVTTMDLYEVYNRHIDK